MECEDKEKAEKIKSLIRLVRETETPGRHSEDFCYSRAAYTAFKEITALRDDGFSLAAICRVMERDGLLPESASLNSFRRAFRRETARRNRATQVPRDGNSISDANGKAIKQEPAAPVRAAPTLAVPASDGKAERVKQLTSSSVKTGSGTIKKLPNGEFEF